MGIIIKEFNSMKDDFIYDMVNNTRKEDREN